MTRNLAHLPLLLLPLAWLLPNHYQPWLSAWQDGWALAMLTLALLVLKCSPRVPLPWLLALGLATVSVVGQWVTGRLGFAGDAVMVLLYLAATAGAISVGNSLAPDLKAGGHGLDALALSIVVAAVLSVGVATVQWTHAFSLGLYGVDMPPGGRPYGNVAQPNHFSTITFLGLCALALLHERGLIGRGGLAFIGLFLILGMVMAVSRTAWVQWLLLLLAVALSRPARQARVRFVHVFVAGVVFAALTAAWPLINAAMLLDSGRPPLVALEGGNGRLPTWHALLHAVWVGPLGGYGWLQTTQAQIAVSMHPPALHTHFEYGHNVVVDLLVWAGAPVGIVLTALLVWGCWQLWRLAAAHPDRRAFWLLMMVFTFGAHAMLEYPHAYAYFLVPIGLSIGAIHALGQPNVALLRNSILWRAGVFATMAMMVVIAIDYLEAEQSHRLLRMESARIGDPSTSSPAPALRVLTQLEAFQAFARTPPRPGLSAQQLEEMRLVANRYAYAPVLYRYALAAGLNGQAEAAERTLQALCSVHLQQRCEEGRLAWGADQSRYPVLRQVRFPVSAPDPA